MQRVRLAEDAWNTRDPAKVALVYAIDSRWRNRSEFINGRNEIIAFLSRKWAKKLDYSLIKEMWAFTGNRIAVRFAYEWHDDSDHWYRSYGNENWEFSDDGLMATRAMLPCFGLDFVAKQRRRDATKSKITRAVTIGQSEAGALAPQGKMRAEDASIAQTELDALP